MAKYRPIDLRIWSDRKFMSLSDEARLLWVFLLTAPSSLPIPGVLIGGPATFAERLGWDVERYGERFREVAESGIGVRSQGQVVWLRNALKYQPPANPNVVIGWAKTWDDIPEVPLKHEIWQALKIACKPWSRIFAKRFPEPGLIHSPNGIGNGYPNGFTQEQEQEQEQEREESPPLLVLKKPPTEIELGTARWVLDKLSEDTQVAYSGNDEQVGVIVARFREGFTHKDLAKVIAYTVDVLGWDDDKMRGNLRPSVLFKREHVLKHIDEARAWWDRTHPPTPPDEERRAS